MLAHKDEIHNQVIKKIHPAIIALSETRLTSEIEDYEVNVPGYDIVRCDAENRSTGGAILYLREDIKYELILIKSLSANCWCVAIDVREKFYRGTLMVVYHSPSASDGDFLRFLEEVVENLVIKGECIIVGDFNIDFKIDSFYTNKLRTIMSSLGMKQLVNSPTRITKDSQTMIDLVFVNNNKAQVHVLHENKITDHEWIEIALGGKKNVSKYRVFTARNYNNFSIVEFSLRVEENIGQNLVQGTNERASRFVNSIVDALDITAPRKEFRIPKVWEGKVWFSDEIREAATSRDKAYRKAITENTEYSWVQYKTERNAVVKIIREKKKEYYEAMIDNNRDDPTNMWKVLKELVKGKPTGAKEINNIDFEILDKRIECSLADKFNMYYIQSIQNIVESIEGTNKDVNRRRSIYVIEDKAYFEDFKLINTIDLEVIIMQLPRKKGTEEGITSDILKGIFPVIKEEFVSVINQSLKEGCCPQNWKTSTIIPIPKVEKARKASEFRPINILPIYEKVLELVVKKQIEDYFESNEYITEHQSGFRKHYSCETAIQTVVNDWKISISEGKVIGVIFMDLKRAFETIDRSRLIEKLYQYGIRGNVLEWIKSYLKNRFQQVRIGNKCSKLMRNEHGVPQGSVLGPLLFIIYINDIIKICPEDYNIKMFADDTLIYVAGEGSAEVEGKLTVIFNIVEEWMRLNMLKMNVSKTKFMVLRSIRKELRGNIVLKCLDGTEIERVEIIKYLGIIIDDKLRFKDHCDYMLKKIGKKTGFLNRIGNYISAYTRCIIYKSIIAPHFEYCATLLVDMGETQLNKLQVAQNRAMRVILQCNRYTKIEHMLQALQFMSIKQRLHYNVCIFIFKILHNLAPNNLSDRLEMISRKDGRKTRQDGTIAIKFCKTRSAQKSICYEGVKLYNALPAEIRSCERIDMFKRMLKEHISCM